MIAYLQEAFKIYLLDIGLLGAITGLKQKSILFEDDLFTHFKGSLVENFIVQATIVRGKTPYYWSSDGKAEVDLILELNDEIYPVEVKSGINLKAKSLKVYDKLFKPKDSVKNKLVFSR